MPKRTPEERIDRYLKKIEKLKKKRKLRIPSYSDSESENFYTIEPQTEMPSTAELMDYEEGSNKMLTEIEPVQSSPIELNSVTPNAVVTTVVGTDMVGTEVGDTDTVGKNDTISIEPNLVSTNPVETNAESTGLDPNILEALGEIVDESPDFGPKIHDNLAKIWTPLLKKGMSKDIREKMLKDYLVPENCPLLKSPILNPEILAAIPETGRYRDKKIALSQQQLGVGITAINRGLNSLLSSENKIEAIKSISDGCRLLSDLHFQNTETRKKFITPSLDKSFLQLIQVSERDDTLFGNKLSDTIKASKAIATQSQQIKKNPIGQKPSTIPTSSRPNNQGNWQGPPRFQSSRGGRGGIKKTIRRVPLPQTVSQPQFKPTQHKSRGIPRHQNL